MANRSNDDLTNGCSNLNIISLPFNIDFDKKNNLKLVFS